MFDVSSFGTKEDLTKGAWLSFENSAGDPVFRIKLTSTDGQVGEKLIYEQVDKRAKRGGQISQPSAEHAVAQNTRLLARLTLEWESLDEEKGEWKPLVRCGEKDLACTYNNAVWLYSNVPMIYDRVNKFVTDPENFVAQRASAEERATDALNGHLRAIEKNSESGPIGASAMPA